MFLTGGPRELGTTIAPEFELRDDPGFDTDADDEGTEVIEAQPADSESPSERGAWGLLASSGRRRDEEEESDYGFDDFEYDDDSDEDDELDDDFDDDEELDDDLDDYEPGEEP